MNKVKLFIENFVVYGLGGIVSKVIPLIMLPIITRLMPDTFYFGLNDLSVTVVSFGSAIAVMGMYDAMFRMFFEKDENAYKKRVCSSGLLFTLLTSFVVFILLFMLRKPLSQLFFSDKRYANLMALTAVSILIGSTNSIVQAPTRMENKRKQYLVLNIAGPVLSYAVAIPLLLKGHYVIALPLASVISAFFLEAVFWILNRSWFPIRFFDWKLLKQMLIIAIPLLPNFLIYWVFNSSDRLMIAKLIGNEYTGIYAVGAKLGHISQLIYTAFAGGWQYFAFSTMREDNQVETNSNIFAYLGVISICCAAFMAALSKPVFELLFEEDYIRGYIVAPYLFLAPLLQMLFQVEANQFLVIKKTWPNLFILSLGALVNIAINLLLIPVMGIEGAALATLLGYIVSDTVCTVVLCRMHLMVVSSRFLVAAAGAVVYGVVWRLYFQKYIGLSMGLAVLLSGLCVYLYRGDIMRLVKRRR